MSGTTRRIAACVAAGFALVAADARGADAAKPITYDDQVAAIFKRHCFQCHGESKQKAGLNLSSFTALVKGSTGGPVVVAGRSSASRLFEVISAKDPSERMPPENDPIPKDDVTTIKAWIDTGLRQNAGSAAADSAAVAFVPAAPGRFDGPPPMPGKLPAVDRPRTVRGFPVLALAASPRAPVAAVGSYECVDLVDPTTRQVLGTLPFPLGEPHVVRFSRSGALLLAAGGRPVQTGGVVLHDVKTGRRLAELGNETDTVIAADIASDERHVAIGGSGRVVKVFSTENRALRQTLVKHTDWVTALAYSPDGKLLASGDRIGNIHLWDARNGGVVLPLAEHKGAVRALAWRSDSQVLASCGEDGLIVWWDVAKGWPAIVKSNAHPRRLPAGYYGKIANGILDVAFGPDGHLASGGRDRTIRVWGPDGGELAAFTLEGASDDLAVPQAPTTPRGAVPTRVAITFDGSAVVAGDSNGRVRSWPLQNRK